MEVIATQLAVSWIRDGTTGGRETFCTRKKRDGENQTDEKQNCDEEIIEVVETHETSPPPPLLY